MTFQELLADMKSWIGGNIETIEGGPGINAKILGFQLDEDIFKVYNTVTDVTVNIKHSKIVEINDRILKFELPYIGLAILYRRSQCVKCSCK